MPPRGVTSAKRKRQYEHIKESELERGVGEDRAEEIAARTVNKQRAQAGETKRSRDGRTSSGASESGARTSSSRTSSSQSGTRASASRPSRGRSAKRAGRKTAMKKR